MRRGPQNRDELDAARRARAVHRTDPAAVDEIADAGGHRVAVRTLTPATTEIRAVFLDIHGGGFYMDSAARGDARNRALAETLGVAVVSVEYRLAPEHPWPAAPDDCEAAARWLIDCAEDRFGTSRLAIGGFSAGATLAMTTLLRLRPRGLAGAFAGAALQFGAYDLSGRTPAGRRIADEYFIQAYAGHVADRTHPDVSPIFADLHDLPPILLVVGGADVLLDDNAAMATRLSAADVPVDHRVYPGGAHGFTSRPGEPAVAALRDIDEWLDRQLRRTHAARIGDESDPAPAP